MYFWKIDKLKEDIKNNEFYEKDRFLYSVIYVTFCAIGLELMWLIPTENYNLWDSLSSFSNILIVFLGTIYAYKSNGGKNGTDFLGRYFSIGFVVTIRFLVLIIPMFVALVSYYIYAFPEDEDIPSSAIDVLPFVLWYAALYWRIGKHISDVKNS
jgi:uncharacterized membrane-anchored protein YitT (DUF2179 family)